MELSRPVVVQHHGHLTSTLDFQSQILKMLYLRNGRADWHGAKGMWVDRMLDSHCDLELWPQPWPWPWIFKVNFLNCCISGTTGPINMERKEYEWIGRCSNQVTLSYDLDLGFWWSNFKKLYHLIIAIRGWIDRNQKDVSHYDVGSKLWLSTLTSPITLTLDFQGQIFDSHILGMGRSINLEWKRCELDTLLDAQWACFWATMHGK